MNRGRWERLIGAFGIREEPGTFKELVAAYEQKHRHYHTVNHIDHCLRELDTALDIAHEPAEVEFALWFHDAVYDPYASDNEKRSADWACAVLTRGGVSGERVERVREHIMATCHNAPVTNRDSQLVVDVDLSILGCDEADYLIFETNVCKEYRWVPAPLFRRKRAEILESFLARPQIYHTAPFHQRYELPARRNLQAAIAALRGHWRL